MAPPSLWWGHNFKNTNRDYFGCTICGDCHGIIIKKNVSLLCHYSYSQPHICSSVYVCVCVCVELYEYFLSTQRCRNIKLIFNLFLVYPNTEELNLLGTLDVTFVVLILHAMNISWTRTNFA